MSMHGSSRRPLRKRASEDDGSHWKVVLNMDENMGFGASCGITGWQRPPGLSASAVPQPNQPLGGQPLAMQLNAAVDVEVIDDDVKLLSSRVFPQGRNQPRRKRPVIVVLDDDMDGEVGSSGIHPDEPEIQVTVNSNSRVGHPPRWISVNREAFGNYRNVECSHSSKRKCLRDSAEPQMAPKQEPVFTCAICLGKLTEETSTNCGHIFCNGCIKTAIKAQKRCPTCRKYLTMKSIHRVYLPTAL